MNRKLEKRIRKKGKKKRLCLSILVLLMLLFIPVFVYASEIKSDEKTTQGIEEENKTVRSSLSTKSSCSPFSFRLSL